MTIRYGGNEIGAVYKGTSSITRVYLGESLLFDDIPSEPATSHRYWRLYHPFSATNGSYMGYGEIELMDDSGIDLTSPADAAARATASSFQVAGTEAAQAFDDVLTKGGAGDYNWWQTSKADNSWIAWDFGEGNEKDISRVRVYSNLDGVDRTLDGARVQYSDDGAIWQTSWVFNGWRSTIGWIDFSRSENRIMDFAMTSDLEIKANETHRVRLASSRLPVMEQFTITMKAATSFPLAINAMTIGYRNMAGGIYEFETTPQTVTFGGNASGAASAGELLTTDTISLPVAGDKDLIVAMHVSSAAVTYASFGYQRSMETGYRTGINDVSGLSGSGYSAYNGHFIHRLDKIL